MSGTARGYETDYGRPREVEVFTRAAIAAASPLDTPFTLVLPGDIADRIVALDDALTAARYASDDETSTRPARIL